MVAPTTGKLKLIIDEVAVQLDTVDNLVIYKYPEPNPKNYPCAIIADEEQRSNEVRATAPQAIYYLKITILVKEKDDQAAFEHLEKYISADSASSVKALMNNAIVAGVQKIEMMHGRKRQRYTIGNSTHWGCEFTIQAIVT